MSARWEARFDEATAPDEGGFWAWWTITDGRREFKTDVSGDAHWLKDTLNRVEKEKASSEGGLENIEEA